MVQGKGRDAKSPNFNLSFPPVGRNWVPPARAPPAGTRARSSRQAAGSLGASPPGSQTSPAPPQLHVNIPHGPGEEGLPPRLALLKREKRDLHVGSRGARKQGTGSAPLGPGLLPPRRGRAFGNLGQPCSPCPPPADRGVGGRERPTAGEPSAGPEVRLDRPHWRARVPTWARACHWATLAGGGGAGRGEGR